MATWYVSNENSNGWPVGSNSNAGTSMGAALPASATFDRAVGVGGLTVQAGMEAVLYKLDGQGGSVWSRRWNGTGGVLGRALAQWPGRRVQEAVASSPYEDPARRASYGSHLLAAGMPD